MQPERFDPATATAEDMAAAHRLNDAIREERGDPVLPFEQYAANLRNIPPLAEVSFWFLREGDAVAGWAAYATPSNEGNEHLAQFEILVHPAHRRRELGARLLAHLTELARSDGRRLVIGDTSSSVPAGEAFARRVGAQAAMEGHRHELALVRVDRELMRSWIERARERASAFDLGWWDGSYPEDRIEEIAVMLDAFNTQPMGDLEVEDMHFTPEQVRQIDATMLARGVTRWTAYVSERATGAIAGFTELFIAQSDPERVEQGLTAVMPPYRNLGIGRWLKAAAVERVLAELPEATTILTTMADTNQVMLSINNQMGFRPARSQTVWQVPLETVEAYLAERETAHTS